MTRAAQWNHCGNVVAIEAAWVVAAVVDLCGFAAAPPATVFEVPKNFPANLLPLRTVEEIDIRTVPDVSEAAVAYAIRAFPEMLIAHVARFSTTGQRCPL